MKVSKLVGLRFKEKPADCVIDSHALMVRGGYIKYVGNGIYSEFPTLKKITSKIEAIIRKEMNAIDGQEVLFPLLCRQICGKSPVVMRASEVSSYV